MALWVCKRTGKPALCSIVQVWAEVGNLAGFDLIDPAIRLPSRRSPKAFAEIEISQHNLLFSALEELFGQRHIRPERAERGVAVHMTGGQQAGLGLLHVVLTEGHPTEDNVSCMDRPIGAPFP